MELNSKEEFEFLSSDSDAEEVGGAGRAAASWVMENGPGLGKKIGIMGCVVLSLPFVIPPLAVVSALGFAVWVPFGFMYVSYAFTEKLMSKLLPSRSIIPPQPTIDHTIFQSLREQEEREMVHVDREEKWQEKDTGEDSEDALVGREIRDKDADIASNLQNREEAGEETGGVKKDSAAEEAESGKKDDRSAKDAETETTVGMKGTEEEKKQQTASKGKSGNSKKAGKKG